MSSVAMGVGVGSGLVVPAELPHVDHSRIPIIGLPIGAGPEGAWPHVGRWENCPLNLAAQTAAKDETGRTRATSNPN